MADGCTSRFFMLKTPSTNLYPLSPRYFLLYTLYFNLYTFPSHLYTFPSILYTPLITQKNNQIRTNGTDNTCQRLHS